MVPFLYHLFALGEKICSQYMFRRFFQAWRSVQTEHCLDNSCVLVSGSCPGKVCSGVAGSPLEDSSGVFLQRKYTLKIIMVKSFPCYD